jgi:hypothetical protein
MPKATKEAVFALFGRTPGFRAAGQTRVCSQSIINLSPSNVPHGQNVPEKRIFLLKPDSTEYTFLLTLMIALASLGFALIRVPFETRILHIGFQK